MSAIFGRVRALLPTREAAAPPGAQAQLAIRPTFACFKDLPPELKEAVVLQVPSPEDVLSLMGSNQELCGIIRHLSRSRALPFPGDGSLRACRELVRSRQADMHYSRANYWVNTDVGGIRHILPSNHEEMIVLSGQNQLAFWCYEEIVDRSLRRGHRSPVVPGQYGHVSAVCWLKNEGVLNQQIACGFEDGTLIAMSQEEGTHTIIGRRSGELADEGRGAAKNVTNVLQLKNNSVICSYSDRVVMVWDLVDAITPRARLQCFNPLTCVFQLKSGDIVIGFSSGEVTTWRPETQMDLLTTIYWPPPDSRSNGGVTSIAELEGVAKIVVGCGNVRGNGRIMVLDPRVPADVQKPESLWENANVGITCATQARQGKIVFGCTNGNIKIWDPKAKRSLKTDNPIESYNRSQQREVSSPPVNGVIWHDGDVLVYYSCGAMFHLHNLSNYHTFPNLLAQPRLYPGALNLFGRVFPPSAKKEVYCELDELIYSLPSGTGDPKRGKMLFLKGYDGVIPWSKLGSKLATVEQKVQAIQLWYAKKLSRESEIE